MRIAQPSMRTLAFCVAMLATTAFAGSHEFDRTVLPIQPPTHDPITVMDARDATRPAPFAVTAPDGAPNVVIVLIDDIGFGATEPFGGRAFRSGESGGRRTVSTPASFLCRLGG